MAERRMPTPRRDASSGRSSGRGEGDALSSLGGLIGRKDAEPASRAPRSTSGNAPRAIRVSTRDAHPTRGEARSTALVGSQSVSARQDLAVRERPSAPSRRRQRSDEEETTLAPKGLAIGPIALPDPSELPISGKTLYSVALFLYLFGMVLWRSMLSVIVGLKMWPFFGIICIMLLVSEYLSTGFSYSRAEAAVLFAGLGLAGLVTVFSRDAVVAVTFLIILVSRTHSFDRICRVAILAFATGLATVLILGAFGVIENHRWVQGRGSRVRYGLGFKYASFSNLYVWFLSVAVFCRFRGRVPKPLAAGLVVFAILLFRYTDARLPMVLTVVLMAASLFDWDSFYPRDEVATLIGNVSAVVFLISAVVSVLLMIGYDSIKFDELLRFDDLLGHRILISTRAFKEFGSSFLGQDIEMVGQ
ncbi:MAG: hypothetical protein IJH87_04020 [Atopobiaceae bacterium]|nr:hypothetical protein [Atopobiaceae bacterium]